MFVITVQPGKVLNMFSYMWYNNHTLKISVISTSIAQEARRMFCRASRVPLGEESVLGCPANPPPPTHPSEPAKQY